MFIILLLLRESGNKKKKEDRKVLVVSEKRRRRDNSCSKEREEKVDAAVWPSARFLADVIRAGGFSSFSPTTSYGSIDGVATTSIIRVDNRVRRSHNNNNTRHPRK